MSAHVSVRPRGSRLDEESALLSVLSYNLLAPAFVRPIDKRTGGVQPFAAFEWAEPAAEVLDWDVRRPRLLAQLSSCGADILCLQEVQFECSSAGAFHLPSWLQGIDGYAWRLPGQNSLQQMAERNERVLGNRVAIGCAVLYRRDRLREVDEGDSSGARGSGDPNTLVGAFLEGQPGSLLSLLGQICVFSVHLDAQSEEKRVEQLRRCLALARRLGTREVLIAGDLNTECLAGSCVGAFVADARQPEAAEMARECASALRLGSGEEGDGDEEVPAASSPTTQEPTGVQLEAWSELWRRAASAAEEQRIRLSHVPTGPTRAAYDHGKSEGPCASWRLDHILYAARTLKLSSCWSTLEADPDSAASGLPNQCCPSDHLPVAAVFEVSPTPCLGDAERVQLMAKVAELEKRHASDCSSLDEELAKLEPPAAVAAEEATASPAPDAKAKNKKKGERPSPEVIAFIQEKRRRLRDLKAIQASDREALVASLGELERDALDLSLCTDTWLESGSRQ
ncbi:unnamed protein product [Polarella glacialis]|uniref:Endonuclease/exonuclease/phosphatase domain-containing protein n=1 Tax=Polarella glacialis TaxID=89957 RepID=A0A813KE22_POLGL|nr:unnamed protein product [Polarella glacialis]